MFVEICSKHTFSLFSQNKGNKTYLGLRLPSARNKQSYPKKLCRQSLHACYHAVYSNALAYFTVDISYACKKFMKLTPGACSTKHITTVLVAESQYSRLFLISIHFHPSLIFVGKDGGAYQSGASYGTPL